MGVKSVAELCRLGLSPRVMGIDDAPFESKPRRPGSAVSAMGIVTTNSRFEGALYWNGDIHMDGLNAGDVLRDAIVPSKFYAQLHAVLLDGVTMGGLNVVDISALAVALDRPVVSIMRRVPDIPKMLEAVSRLPHAAESERRLRDAGRIFEVDSWIFQYRWGKTDDDRQPPTPEEIAQLLDKCTPTGGQKIPEYVAASALSSAIPSRRILSSMRLLLTTFSLALFVLGVYGWRIY